MSLAAIADPPTVPASRLARRCPVAACCGLLAALLGPAAAHAQTVRSGAGANAAAILGVVDQFRTDLGTLNANVAGSFGSGRREINWDGVPDARSAPNSLPADFFNVNSPRGVVFSTPGNGFQVSATAASGTAVEFGNMDPSYPGTFASFSPQRLFTALGSNVVDVNFFVPGANTPALVSGFGSFFSDVDLANTTSIQLFGAGNVSLGTFFAPVGGVTNESLSFLGISYAVPTIARVRITSGNAVLGAGVLDTNGNPVDLVVMDDFIYGEPQALGQPGGVVPEPTALALAGAGLLPVGLARIRRRRRAR